MLTFPPVGFVSVVPRREKIRNSIRKANGKGSRIGILFLTGKDSEMSI